MYQFTVAESRNVLREIAGPVGRFEVSQVCIDDHYEVAVRSIWDGDWEIVHQTSERGTSTRVYVAVCTMIAKGHDPREWMAVRWDGDRVRFIR